MTEEQNFADLLEESYEEPVVLEPGQKVKATVVRISKDWVFIDLGGKSEGCFSVSEVSEGDAGVTLKEGDSVEAYFLSAGKGGMKFTTRLGKGAEANEHLEEAFRAEIPVEGTIEKEVKGGFSVKIAGSVRAFCPFSQLGFQRLEEEDLSGRQLAFQIIEYGESGKNIIVSHRKILDVERRRQMEELKDSLKEGMIVKGTVVSIQKFGAFIDIGGIQGLLPISEICWGHVEDISERLQVGQEVEVAVMKLDWEKERFSFSLKQVLADPWLGAADKYPEGSVHMAQIVRLTHFGAFATLEEGVDGLLHISTLGGGRRISHPREVVEVGQEIEVRIEKLDLAEKRISLALNAVESAPEKKQAESPEAGERKEFESYRQDKKQSQKQSFGTLGDLLAAKLKK